MWSDMIIQGFEFGWRGHGANFRLLKGEATAAGVTYALLVHIGKADLLTQMPVFGQAKFVGLSAFSEGTSRREL